MLYLVKNKRKIIAEFNDKQKAINFFDDLPDKVKDICEIREIMIFD
jgi:hypothetical protein